MNITALKARADELMNEVQVKVKAVQDGVLTYEEFEPRIEALKIERDGILAKIKAYNQATAWQLGNPGDGSVPKATGALSHMTHLPDGAEEKRLTFKGMGAKLADKMLSTDVSTKTATLAPSGASVVAQEFEPNVVALGRPAYSILELLPVIPHDSPNFAYLRQTSRTNNAAVVPDFGTKPTSTYGTERVESSLSVIAHLSEGIPRYWFTDNAELQNFVQQELDYGLRIAVEAKVIADIHSTSGILTQAFSTSAVVTIRKALTRLEVNELLPSAIVFHPDDWETVELMLATATAIEYRNLPYDPAARRLYGVPVVTCVRQTPGAVDVLARESVFVDVDTTGVQVQWSENSNDTDFVQNLIRARFEGRWATSVKRPLGVVHATVVAGS